jgi:hypothetical protein
MPASGGAGAIAVSPTLICDARFYENVTKANEKSSIVFGRSGKKIHPELIEIASL